ncbi:MAG: hypothetical protein BroJett040_20970 [Oligoflexia bacterium]|nr:MAG: hypothetical protein BroJett040_20970 [Oligoflexia bacterium]
MNQTRHKNLTQTLQTLALWTAGIISQLTSVQVQAQPWYLSMRNDFESVIVENLSNESQYFWISGPVDPSSSDAAQKEETTYSINAKEKMIIPLNEKKNWSWIQIKSYDDLQFKVSVQTKTETIALQAGRSNTLNLKSSLFSQDGVLQITNLSPIEQEAHLIQNSASQKKEVGLVKLSKFETKTISLSVDRVSSLAIEADYPVTGFWLQQKTIQPLSLEKSHSKFSNSSQSQFLLSNRSKTQSFVFTTSDPELIKAAREQIRYPNKALPRIFVATIQKGHSNQNKDKFALQSPWSWSVKEAIRFADFGHQACDGSPQLVEDFLLPWLEADQAICFWNYRVVEELQTQLAP